MLQEQGISGHVHALEVILDSWGKGTKKRYSTYISQWASYCEKRNTSLTKPSLLQVLNFLTSQSLRLGYSAVASTRNTLSSFIKLDGLQLGEHPLVSRFMTGLLNRKPAIPRYVQTWNPQIVLNYKKSTWKFPFVTEATNIETYCTFGSSNSPEDTNLTCFCH